MSLPTWTSTVRTRAGLRSLAAAVAGSALALGLAPPASAAIPRTFEAVAPASGPVVFHPRGIRPGAILDASVRVGRYNRVLRLRRVRRAAGRGRIAVAVPRRALRRARQSSRPRPRPRLILRTRRFPGFDGYSATGGSLTPTAATARRVLPVLRAYNDGGAGLSFARAWFDVDWRTGTEIRYGASFLIPSEGAGHYANILRWDNHRSYGSNGDVGGVELSDGRLSLFRADYDGDNYARLVEGIDFPRDRWFRLDVRQRFSGVELTGLSELYLDGQLVGTSIRANSRGRPIDDLRVGYVYVEGAPSAIYFDRLSISRPTRDPLIR